MGVGSGGKTVRFGRGGAPQLHQTRLLRGISGSTLSPSKAPALSPSKAPALSPSKAPALSPSKAPALSPSKAPALSLSKGACPEPLQRGLP
jgi:hypothetical protein